MSQSQFQPLRGTQDLYGLEARQWRAIESIAFNIASAYGYQEIRTPLIESTGVFHRTLGESSDAVQKESYTFIDRGGESVTLRTEGTAPIARALVSNSMTHELPLKFYYSGPMFRYERPQKGRMRQFHQIGFEAMGYPEAWTDIECIEMAARFLNDLGIGQSTRLEINTLGDAESRNQHRSAFLAYMQKYKSELSPDSQVRLEKNPLRIFDSKDPNDQKIVTTAPKLDEHLNSVSKNFFDSVLEGLEKLNISFVVNQKLVRGFDYYSHTVFEFTTDLLGAQSAVLAGGRYNQLVTEMGGPETPSIGWAAGVERLHLLSQNHLPLPNSNFVMLLPMSNDEIYFALQAAQVLRQSNLATDLLTSGKLVKRIQKSEKRQAHFVGIIGSEELKSSSVTVKHLASGQQQTVPLDHLVGYLKNFST